MSDTHIIDRSKDCHIIKNATDKPISLSMHHFHARSMIINLKTGDVLSYLFADSMGSSAQRNFETSAICQLEHNIFLEQDGEKVLFVLRTNYGSPLVSRYINQMIEKGVTFASEITADIKNECSFFEDFQYGEISTVFTIDLNEPNKFKTYYRNEFGSEYSQDTVKNIGSEPSTLPNMKEQARLYFSYSNIGRLIAWADERLPEELKKSGIILSDLSGISGHIADAIKISMDKEQPFSSDHLYEKKYETSILDTLNLVKEKGLDPISTSSLCGNAGAQLIRRINNCHELSDFFHFVLLAQNIMSFAFALTQEQNSDEMRNKCVMQMGDIFVRLQQFILYRFEEFEIDKIPEHSTKLPEKLKLPSSPLKLTVD